MATTRIRVTLRYLEILDRKDLDQYGEFVFQFRGAVPERDVEVATRIPDQGHLSISDHPSMNKLTMNQVIFEGEVGEGESLVVEASGEELDRFSANDQLQPYRREFTGPVRDWLGEHSPWDQGSEEEADPEQLGDWRFAFAIEEIRSEVATG
jgi:hypothetical protein